MSEPNPNRRRIINEIAPYAVVVNPRDGNLAQVVGDLTEEGVGVDVALECVGLEASLNACVQAVRRQGKVVQVGLHMKPASIDAMLWALKDIAVDTVFLGSCTNGRIEDLRAAAEVLRGRKVADSVTMLVVPGSVKVREQAMAEGLHEVFTAAGARWRNAGCSMCLAMNPDKLRPQERSASTSNRNFEGRQGPGGRTHLVSPEVAAATAVVGRLAAPSDLNELVEA